MPPVLTYHLEWSENSCWLDASLVVLASCNTFRRFLNALGEMPPDYPILRMLSEITALLTNPPVPGGSLLLKDLKDILCHYLQQHTSGPAITSGLFQSSCLVIERLIGELGRINDPRGSGLVRSNFLLSYERTYPTCGCVEAADTMMFCLLKQADLCDGMSEDAVTRHSGLCPPPVNHVYSFLEPFPEMIFVDTATDLNRSRKTPAETVILKGVTYKLHGGTCFVNGSHYHAVIHRPEGWVDVDSMDVPRPLFAGYSQTLPPVLPVFGWMVYEKQLI
jgi:hypothetical protein